MSIPDTESNQRFFSSLHCMINSVEKITALAVSNNAWGKIARKFET